MEIKYVEQIRLDDKRIRYEIEGQVIKVVIDDFEDVFDFTKMPNGELVAISKTTLEVNPILSAKKKDGILYISLLKWIGES